MTPKTLPQWIPLHEAVNIEGSMSPKRLSEWINRWNHRTDTVHKIRRRPNKVELHSLIAALEEEESSFGKSGEDTRQALRKLSSNRQFRRSAPEGAR